MFRLPNVAALADTRHVQDPWGFGLTVEILRADHPEWLGWLKENGLTGRQDALSGQLMAAMLATEMEAAKGRKGFRRRKKGGDIDYMQAVKKVDFSQLEADQGQSLEDLKPGIASVLMRSMSGLEELDGTRAADTVGNRIKLLENVRNEDGQVIWVPLFLQGQLDKDGNPVEAPYGDQPVGDAIAEWLLDEAEATSEFRRVSVAEGGKA